MATKKVSTKKKAAAKKKVAPKKKAAAKTAAGPAVKGKPWTQAQTVRHLAETSGLPAKQVKEMMSELASVAERHLKKGAVGNFTIPGLARLKVKVKPATKARKGVNPFTGEPMTFKAKPARRVVKAQPAASVRRAVE